MASIYTPSSEQRHQFTKEAEEQDSICQIVECFHNNNITLADGYINGLVVDGKIPADLCYALAAKGDDQESSCLDILRDEVIKPLEGNTQLESPIGLMRVSLEKLVLFYKSYLEIGNNNELLEFYAGLFTELISFIEYIKGSNYIFGLTCLEFFTEVEINFDYVDEILCLFIALSKNEQMLCTGYYLSKFSHTLTKYLKRHNFFKGDPHRVDNLLTNMRFAVNDSLLRSCCPYPCQPLFYLMENEFTELIVKKINLYAIFRAPWSTYRFKCLKILVELSIKLGKENVTIPKRDQQVPLLDHVLEIPFHGLVQNPHLTDEIIIAFGELLEVLMSEDSWGYHEKVFPNETNSFERATKNFSDISKISLEKRRLLCVAYSLAFPVSPNASLYNQYFGDIVNAMMELAATWGEINMLLSLIDHKGCISINIDEEILEIFIENCRDWDIERERLVHCFDEVIIEKFI